MNDHRHPQLGPLGPLGPLDPLAYGEDADLLLFGSGHYGSKPPRFRREPDRGKKVLCEVLLVAFVLTLGLAGVGGQYAAENWNGLEAHRQDRASELLRETVQALDAYSFESLHGMDGSAIHETGSPETSDFKVELAITPLASGMLRIEAVLRDTKTRRKLNQMVTYRGRT